MISGSNYFEQRYFSNTGTVVMPGIDDFMIPVPQNMLYMKHELDRTFCEYCHGYTKMDDRGNCVACGAPKHSYGDYL